MYGSLKDKTNFVTNPSMGTFSSMGRCNTFHYHPAKHGYVFDMVCITVQVQMECGAELFVV